MNDVGQEQYNILRKSDAVAQRCSIKEMLLKISQNSGENTCGWVSFLIKLQAETCNFILKKALAQAFSCEFSEIFKNTFFYKTPPMVASDEIMKG